MATWPHSRQRQYAGGGPGGPNSLTLKTPEAVSATFAAVEADRPKRILVYGGNGIAATLDAVFLHQLEYQNVAVFQA